MSVTCRASAIVLMMAISLTVVELSLHRASAYVSTNSNADWIAFKTRFAKNYNSSEETYRRNVRQQNLRLLVAHNEAAAAGKHSFTLGENAFIDWTSEEYQNLLGFKATTSGTRGKRAITSRYPPYMPTYANTVSVSSLPTCVNWTQHGWVGQVTNQGKCGACWAYSASGAIESQYYNLTGKTVQLSQQNLIDCSTPEGNQGCGGGNMQDAFWYVQQNGIESLANYPDVSFLTGSSAGRSCSFNPSLSVTSLASWRNIQSTSETALQQAVALVGPVSAGIDASSSSFQQYASGIYSSTTCGSSVSDLDHAILVVGYGVYNNQPYWLIQNSWSTSWGMNGYMMLARGSNMCGIATDATFPVISQSSTAASGVSTTGTCNGDQLSSSNFSPSSVSFGWRPALACALMALVAVLCGSAHDVIV